MVAWSSFRTVGPLFSRIFKNSVRNAAENSSRALVPVRQMSEHRTLDIVPSRFQWVKFKDMLHFYICVGAIPWIVLITCVNIFIGPAQLAPIPEGYVPKEWEYHRHPISRFIAKYMVPTFQEEYERQLHLMYEEEEKIHMVELEMKVLELMALKSDYKLFWHRPVTTKYHQYYKEQFQYLEDEVIGENVDSFP